MMEIKWSTTINPQHYPYLLEEYYLQIGVERDDSITPICVSIEHPKSWNVEDMCWDIDFENKIICVNKQTYNFSQISEAQEYIDDLISELQIQIVDGLDQAKTRNPLLTQ